MMPFFLLLLAYVSFEETPCTPPSSKERKQLFSELNQESKRLYNSLDCSGKNRAVELSTKYFDKNQAVQKAAKEMGQRNLEKYRQNQDYQNTLRQRSGQKPYNKYGY